MSFFSSAFKERLFKIAFCTDLLALRFFLGLAAILTGIGLLWPSEIFPDVGTAHHLHDQSRMAYVYMAALAPEWLWGAAFFTQGCVTMWSLLHDYRTRAFLWFDAAFGCFMWTVSMISCYASYWIGFDKIAEYPLPAILGIGLTAVIASWWALVRYSVEGHPCKR